VLYRTTMDFLKTLKVPSPVFPNEDSKLITINSDASVSDGFKTLINYNIVSVPIYDEKTQTYLSSLSLVDVVLHAIDSISDIEADISSGVSCALNILSEKEHFRSYKAKDIAGRSKQPLPVVSNPQVTIDHVVDIMVKTKAHHVLALKGNELCNIITQSRIVECISMLFDVDPGLTALGRKTVQELGMGLRDVVSVYDSTKAADAFRMLAEKNVTGMAVLNNSATLVGNISIRDLRAIKSNATFLKLLLLPLYDYLEAAHNQFGISKATIKCGLHDTYKAVMERIVENKVHRCFVVNDSNELVGVVTMWDLLNQLLTFTVTTHAP